MARSARRASFTDFESGNAWASSGSSRTTFTPRRYWSAYFPRTPPEKSYSALICVARLMRGFFVLASFMPCRGAGADQADPHSSHSMNHNQELPRPGHPDDDETLFASDMIRVRDRDGERITEDRTRVRKPDVVFSPIRQFPLRIPLERQSLHPTSSLTNRQERCQAGITWSFLSYRCSLRIAPVLRHSQRTLFSATGHRETPSPEKGVPDIPQSGQHGYPTPLSGEQHCNPPSPPDQPLAADLRPGTTSTCNCALAAGTSVTGSPSSLRTMLQPCAIALAL
jgi:hypothetical protein